MPGTAANSGAQLFYKVRRFVSIREIADVLLAGQADHHPQAVVEGDVEQLARRHRMRNPHCVETAARHRGEVALDALVIPVLAAGGVRPKRPVGDAAEVKLVVAGGKELALNPRPASAGAR